MMTRELVRPRIAVIDDDAVFVELMCDLLAGGEGYEVVSSPHWAQSLDLVRETQPRLVILDLMMGREQTGWAVIDLLRHDPLTAHIPIILCSAAAPALSKHRQQLSEQGAIETLPKPFDVDHLLEVIERLLAQSARVACPSCT